MSFFSNNFYDTSKTDSSFFGNKEQLSNTISKNNSSFYLKKNFPFLLTLENHLKIYPTPQTLNYFWNFGFMSGIFLVIQIVTGLFLAMHFSSNYLQAFDSVEHIMRNVNFGWFFRYVHSNGASFFFIVLYLHMARGFFFESYRYHTYTWISGIVILLLTMATAFLGYVLPYGQMSLWGATVITNLFSTIPFIGQDIVYTLWGGFSVGAPTLSRFFVFHFILPFVILFLVFIHLTFLHIKGSSSPFNKVYPFRAKIYNNFFPYSIVKDMISLNIFIIIFLAFVLYEPNILAHPDNYIKANPMSTPAHIVPEWYFLPFYGILRSIPDKGLGVLAMGASIIILLVAPLLCKLDFSTFLNKFSSLFFKGKSNNFFGIENHLRDSKLAKNLGTEFHLFFTRPQVHNFLLWFFLINFVFLGWIGSQPAEEPYLSLGLLFTFYYFFLFILYTLTDKKKV